MRYSVPRGGDFDWAFGMRIGAFNANLFGSNPTASWNNKFYNTAELSYRPPSGVTEVRSASGVFPGTTAIAGLPEPGSLALIAISVVAFSMTRRQNS